jgi:hypothetical protein
VSTFEEVFWTSAQEEPLSKEEEARFQQEYLDSLEDLCDYDASKDSGGMFHCPKCECMIVASMKHPKCDPDFCGMSVYRK